MTSEEITELWGLRYKPNGKLQRNTDLDDEQLRLFTTRAAAERRWNNLNKEIQPDWEIVQLLPKPQPAAMTSEEIERAEDEACRQEMSLPRSLHLAPPGEIAPTFFRKGFRAGIAALQGRQAEQAAAQQTHPMFASEGCLTWKVAGVSPPGVVMQCNCCGQQFAVTKEDYEAGKYDQRFALYESGVKAEQAAAGFEEWRQELQVDLEKLQQRQAARVAEFRRRLLERMAVACEAQIGNTVDYEMVGLDSARKLFNEIFAAERLGEE